MPAVTSGMPEVVDEGVAPWKSLVTWVSGSPHLMGQSARIVVSGGCRAGPFSCREMLTRVEGGESFSPQKPHELVWYAEG